MSIHKSSGHSGMQRTTYYIRRICLVTTKAAIKLAIWTCEECQFIDPAPVHWEKGTLEVNGNWQRLVIDIMLYGAHHFLTLTDCGPSHFSIWRQLVRQDSASVIRQQEMMFFEHDSTRKLLTDNDTGFCSREFKVFMKKLPFCCMYIPARNAIAEWCPHTVKRIAARIHCPI